MRKVVNNQKPKRRQYTPSEIEHIQYLASLGATNSAIAKQFGTNPSQVSKLRHRKTYAPPSHPLSGAGLDVRAGFVKL